MSIHITHKRLSGGQTHQHITDVQWVGDQSGESRISTKKSVVDWIDDGGLAYVGYGASQVVVATVHPDQGAAYLRTHADGSWSNNLLELPDC